jgi:hypothetical protein
MKFSSSKLTKLTTVALAVSLLAACGDDEVIEVERIVEVIVEVPAEIPAPVPFSYTVTVTNLTHAQPFSPVAVVLHENGYLWQVGEVASVDIELMAEGGDNSRLIALPQALTSMSGAMPIGPGGNDTFSLTVNDIADAKLSITSMLVNTNDAFTGLNAWDLGQLEAGESWTTQVGVYDSGTESNSEAAGSIPGPVDGGEGFNAMRNDVGFVARHSGVVTSDDGLPNSVLTGLHKFDSPAMRITVVRTE